MTSKEVVKFSLHSLLGNGSVNVFPQRVMCVTIEELLDSRICGSVYLFTVAR
jgi:hypothetical protein